MAPFHVISHAVEARTYTTSWDATGESDDASGYSASVQRDVTNLAVQHPSAFATSLGQVMYIESVALRNFQCFGDQPTVIVLDRGLTAFIGANGAGKTAACHALQRLFGITADDRTIRIDDFHVPASETDPPQSRQLTVEAILAFPELLDDSQEGKGAVPEFFHRMAADDNGTLKYRIVLEATWDADGTVDGHIETRYWAVHTLDEIYSEDDRTSLPGAERARIQLIYVPASRDGARQVTAFLRGRLWRAARWSDQLCELVENSAKKISSKFHGEPATAAVEEALAKRWLELHGAGTHSTPRFEPIEPDVAKLLSGAELLFQPDHDGSDRSARMLSDGQRSLLHMALTAATLDIENTLVAGSLAASFDMTAAHLPVLTVLAIEEPENSLAPFYLSRIIGQVLQLCEAPRAQAVLASHSASVLNRIEPARIRYFRLDTDVDTATVCAITLPESDTDAGKYVREAVRAHPELYFAQFVVLGEGDTEELVIPRIAQGRGVELDPSFVAMVPLGGRHTNHFWKLLSDLHIPYATLLDLDYGRADAGPARLRDACRRLADNGVDVFGDLDGFDKVEDLLDTMTTDEMNVVMDRLRQFGVFFSTPLDLDMAMLRCFWDAYTILGDGQLGPQDSDAAEAVLGKGGSGSAYWHPADPDEQEERGEWLRWYRYLFLNRSKPSTHLGALSLLTDDALKDGPEPVLALIDYIKTKLDL
jgi:predicted ATP-dependent endonuclease of OLD family